MRTSLTEVQQIEHYLSGTMSSEESLLLEAKMVLDNQFRIKVTHQKEAYSIVRTYGRKKLKAEIDAVHQKLFSELEFMGFKQKILRLFKPY